MSTTPAEEKLRLLASMDTTLRGYLGTNPFRWCDRQLVQGYLPRKYGDAAPGGGTSSVRVRRISTINEFAQQGPSTTEKIRFQVDVLDLYADVCKRAALAVMAWFNTINLVTGQQFGSPPVTPNQFPNFVSNLRSGLEAQPGAPVYVESVDVVVYNSTLN